MNTTIPAGGAPAVCARPGVQIICATTAEAMAVRRLLQSAVMDEDARWFLLRESSDSAMPEIDQLTILDASTGRTVTATRAERRIRRSCAGEREEAWRFAHA